MTLSDMVEFWGYKKVADMYGVSPSTIRHRVKTEDNPVYISKRSKKGDLPEGYRRCSMYDNQEELNAFLKKLYTQYCNDFLTQKEIGKKYGLSQEGVSYHIRKNKVVYM